MLFRALASPERFDAGVIDFACFLKCIERFLFVVRGIVDEADVVEHGGLAIAVAGHVRRAAETSVEMQRFVRIVERTKHFADIAESRGFVILVPYFAPDGERLFEGIERFFVAAQGEVCGADVRERCCLGGLLAEFVHDGEYPLKMLRELQPGSRA